MPYTKRMTVHCSKARVYSTSKLNSRVSVLKAGLLSRVTASPGRACMQLQEKSTVLRQHQSPAAAIGSLSGSATHLRKSAAGTATLLLSMMSMFLAKTIPMSVHRLDSMPFRRVMFLGLLLMWAVYTATAIPFICSFSGNSAASAPISTFMCL